MRTLRTCLPIAMLAFVLAAPAGAADQGQAGGPTPPRVRFLDGDVSFWRTGAEDWAPAKTNTPLAPGDELYAGERANFEVELGPGAFVRGSAGTELGLETLENGFAQFKVTSGHASVDLREHTGTIEVDTPHGAFTIDDPGYYRFDVEDARTTFVARRGGKASVIPAGGEQTDVAPDTQAVLEGNDESAQLETHPAPEPDEWDQWNTSRGQAEPAQPQSARYLPRGVSGAEDLDRNGSWRQDPQYGPVWTPSAVAPDWAPYSTGHWVWDPYYGWTWVDDAPWGWAPFHYGRWVYVGGAWGWAPGPVAVAPVYSPALVAFYAPPVSVTIGVPFGWVALGFGEPLIPWWGPVGFIGHCWWGGWGGPHVVNNVVIQRNTYVNVRNVTVYRNARVHDAVVGVHREGFGRPGGQHMRLSQADVGKLRPVHGNIPIHPTRESLAPAAGRAVRPPDAVQKRQVVATRPAQDPRPHLRASGLTPTAAQSPPPRLVQRPGNANGGRQRQIERAAPARDRSTPPPPPGQRGGAAVTQHPAPQRGGGTEPGAATRPHATPRAEGQPGGPARPPAPAHAPPPRRETFPSGGGAQAPRREGGGTQAPRREGGGMPAPRGEGGGPPAPRREGAFPGGGAAPGGQVSQPPPVPHRSTAPAAAPAPAPGYPRGGGAQRQTMPAQQAPRMSAPPPMRQGPPPGGHGGGGGGGGGGGHEGHGGGQGRRGR